MKIRPVGGKFDTDVQTDRLEEANSNYSEFCEGAPQQ